MLMDYIENFANKNCIDYDIYDSAKYAAQERTFEKTTNFECEFLKQEIEKYQKQNIDKNIKY